MVESLLAVSDEPLRVLPGDAAAVSAAVARWRSAGLGVRTLRGSRARSTPALLDEAADALELPPWFGRNYDALDEALRDLGWAGPPGTVLVVADADQVLVDEPGRLRTLVAVLGGAHAAYALPTRASTPAATRPALAFHVVLQQAPGTDLDRWRSAGATPRPLGPPDPPAA